MTSTDARSALAFLLDEQRRREVQHNSRSAVRVDEDDDDDDRECPIFDYHYEKDGNNGITKLINFTAAEFRDLHSKIHTQVITRWNIGRGRKSRHTSMDVCFMACGYVCFANECTHTQITPSVFRWRVVQSLP